MHKYADADALFTSALSHSLPPSHSNTIVTVRKSVGDSYSMCQKLKAEVALHRKHNF